MSSRAVEKMIGNALLTTTKRRQKKPPMVVARATSRDPQIQTATYAEISELRLSRLELLSEAHRGSDGFESDESAECHDAKICRLERRRREVKHDYDLLRNRGHTKAIIEQLGRIVLHAATGLTLKRALAQLQARARQRLRPTLANIGRLRSSIQKALPYGCRLFVIDQT